MLLEGRKTCGQRSETSEYSSYSLTASVALGKSKGFCAHYLPL